MALNLCGIFLTKTDLIITFNWILITLLTLLFIVANFSKIKNIFNYKKVTKVEIEALGIKCEIQNSYEVKQIAYALWTELNTRKLA